MISWKRFMNLEVVKSAQFLPTADISVRQQNGTINTRKAAKVFGAKTIGRQAAPPAKTTSVTLTAAELLSGLLTSNQGAAGAASYTLPLAADLEGALLAYGVPEVDDAFDFTLLNVSAVAAEDATIVTNTGWTLVGSMVVESNEATAQKGPVGVFRARRTGVSAFSLYRVG